MSRSRMYCLCLAVLVLLLFLSNLVAANTGNAERGEDLFVGRTTFELGGAPCLACHNLSGLGMAEGANYAPDLSSLYQDYGHEGVQEVLQSLAFAGMEAIFTDRPLNESEQADLLAFLQQTSQHLATSTAGKLALHISLGVAALLILTFLVGLRRIHATRQPLIDSQRKFINKGGLQ